MDRTPAPVDVVRAELDAGAPFRPKPNGAGHGLPLLTLDEIDALPPVAWLVRGLLPEGDFAAITGEPGSTKSFLALGLGLSIAYGRPWQGRPVKQGPVIYMAGEGVTGLRKRIRAWRQHEGLLGQPAPFYLMPTRLSLLDEADVDRLAETLRARGPFALAVTDTLARFYAGGDENSASDMGRFVDACDRLREAGRGCVLVVHHSPKTGKGARGSSALLGALDTCLEVTRDGRVVTLRIEKSKDADPGEPITLEMAEETVGLDADGEPETSIVLVESDAPARQRPKVTGAAKVALDMLRQAIEEAGQPAPPSARLPDKTRGVSVALWRSYCARGQISDGDTPDAARKAFKRSADRLQAAGFIGVFQDFVWLT